MEKNPTLETEIQSNNQPSKNSESGLAGILSSFCGKISSFGRHIKEYMVLELKGNYDLQGKIRSAKRLLARGHDIVNKPTLNIDKEISHEGLRYLCAAYSCARDAVTCLSGDVFGGDGAETLSSDRGLNIDGILGGLYRKAIEPYLEIARHGITQEDFRSAVYSAHEVKKLDPKLGLGIKKESADGYRRYIQKELENIYPEAINLILKFAERSIGKGHYQLAVDTTSSLAESLASDGINIDPKELRRIYSSALIPLAQKAGTEGLPWILNRYGGIIEKYSIPIKGLTMPLPLVYS